MLTFVEAWVVTTAVHPLHIVNLHKMESPCIQQDPLHNTVTDKHRKCERKMKHTETIPPP